MIFATLPGITAVLRAGLFWLAIAGLSAGGAAELTGPTEIPSWYREEVERLMTNSSRARTEAEARLAQARAAGDEVEEGFALIVIGQALGRINDIAGALRLTEPVTATAVRLGHRGLLLAARSANAGLLRANDDLPAAIELYLANLRDSEQWGVARAHRMALLGLATCYQSLGDPDHFLEFARRGFAATELAEDPVQLGNAADLLGQAWLGKGDLDAARRYFTRALELRRQAGRRTEAADSEHNLAMLDFREGRAAEALAALDRVVAQRRTLRGRAKLTNALVDRAEVLQQLGRLEEALAAVEEAASYAANIATPGLRSSVHYRLSAVLEARGDFARALTEARNYFDVEFKISGESAQRRVAELQTRYEVARKDEELARLTRDNEVRAAEARAREALLAKNTAELRAAESDLARSRAVRWSLIGGGVGSAVALGALVLALRARLRAEHLRLKETRRAQVAAEEANSLKTQLLGIASHDLKSPLRAMLVRAEQLEPVLAESTVGTAALAQLRTDGERMLGIVHDLLDVAAIEAGELRLRFAPVDLGAVAADVTRALLEPAQLKSLTLTCAVPPAPAWVRGDATRLHQVVTNLVDNAVKFSPPGKAVAVRVTCGAADAIVSVRDEGPGISPEDLARMFQPFQTLSAVPTAGESSSGLGLHICREIVARHGGRIEVDSAPWKGATFSVVLPAAPPAPAAASLAAKTAHDVGL